MPRQFMLALAVVTTAACGATPAALTEAERQAIARDVHATVEAFAEAERRRDTDAVLSYLHPDFYMYGDGVRADYETVVRQIRQSMPTLQRFDTEWSDVEVTVLSRDHALVSMTFRDDITDAAGNVTRQWGPTTFVWRLAAGRWQLVYVDADHYPVESESPGRAGGG